MPKNRKIIYSIILVSLAGICLLLFAMLPHKRAGVIDQCRALIPEAQITQYPAALRSTITRMIITGNIPIDEWEKIDFTSPKDVNYQCSKYSVFGILDKSTGEICGGGAAEQAPPQERKSYFRKLSAEEKPYYKKLYLGDPKVVFTWGNRLSTSHNTDLFYILYPLNKPTCEFINNKGLGLKGNIIKLPVTPNLTPFNLPVAESEIVTLPTENGFICYEAPDGKFYYMHALIERDHTRDWMEREAPKKADTNGSE